MKKTAKGPFDVKGTPRPPGEMAPELGAMRMTFHKRFHGDLEATSVAEMMGVMDQEIGSGGYVALERLTGTLHGRKGSFCLQHSSIMNRGKPTQSIMVVPDSGTEELSGITGTMVIDIKEDDSHFYTFEYSLS